MSLLCVDFVVLLSKNIRLEEKLYLIKLIYVLRVNRKKSGNNI